MRVAPMAWPRLTISIRVWWFSRVSTKWIATRGRGDAPSALGDRELAGVADCPLEGPVLAAQLVVNLGVGTVDEVNLIPGHLEMSPISASFKSVPFVVRMPSIP